jgi:hypothetical protein
MSVQLFLLFLFLVTASTTDIKTGKVRNKDILIFLVMGVFYYAVFLAKGLYAEIPSTLPMLKYAGINVLVAFVCSFFVRSIGLWPAGDAKTFVIACLLIPIVCYKHVYFNVFPGFTLLLNIFIVGIVYIMYNSAVMLVKETIPAISPGMAKDALKNTIRKLSTNRVSYLKSFSAYMIVYFTMNIISQLILSRISFLESIAPGKFNILLFFIMRPAGNFVSKYLKGINHAEFYLLFFLYAFYTSGWSLDKMDIVLLSMIVNALRFMLLYGVIRTAADYYINKVQVNTIDRAALKYGDLPTKEFLDSLSPETRTQLRISPEGLSAENLELIMKELSGKKGGTGKATIYEPIPFVPIIFAGVIFTVITGVSLASYIKLFVFR